MEAVLAESQRAWLRFMHTPQRREFLHTANHAVVTELLERPGNTRLLMVSIGINIELGNIEAALDQLEAQNQYRGHYRANEPAAYAQLLYLRAMVAIKTADHHGSNKFLKNLEDFISNDKQSWTNTERGLALTLLGMAHLACGRKGAFGFFERAHSTGWRGALLFAHTYMLLRQRFSVHCEGLLVTHTLHWAVRQGLAVGELLDFYAEEIRLPGYPAFALYEALLEECQADWLIQRICKEIMSEGSTSVYALEIYELAAGRQIEIEGLACAVVRAAFVNGKEQISRYVMKEFLRGIKGLETDIVAFAYHVLLSTPRLTDMVNSDDVLGFALECRRLEVLEASLGAPLGAPLEAHLSSNSRQARYVNSLYRYLLEKGIREDGRWEEQLYPIAEALEDSLFAWEIDVNNAETVWVRESVFRDSTPYSASARISASSEGFACYGISAEGGLVSVGQVRNRLVSRPGHSLLYAYFKQGNRRDELIVALASYHIALSIDPSTKTNKPNHRISLERGLEVLVCAYKLVRISEGFRQKCMVGLGMSLAMLGRTREAIGVFERIEASTRLSKHTIDTVVSVFSEHGHIEEAIRFSHNYAGRISKGVLFRLVKKAVSLRLALHIQSLTAELAYTLMLDSWFDKQFMEFVLQYHLTTHDDWCILSDNLYIIGEESSALNVRVLESALSSGSLRTGKSEQRAFAQLYAEAPSSKILLEYALACSYEAIYYGFVPEGATIDIMAGMFAQSKDARLAYAIVGVHNNASYDTAITMMINYLFTKGILHPEFSGINEARLYGLSKDWDWNEDMIAKVAFVHRAAPKRDVYLHYRIIGEAEEFSAMRMEYAFFGMYVCLMSWFYGERIEYYFSETTSAGSIDTPRAVVTNSQANLGDWDSFRLSLNNALIQESMFRYDKVEEFLAKSMQDNCRIATKII